MGTAVQHHTSEVNDPLYIPVNEKYHRGEEKEEHRGQNEDKALGVGGSGKP